MTVTEDQLRERVVAEGVNWWDFVRGEEYAEWAAENLTAAYVEAEHPRDPGGEGGGRWIEKGASAADEPEKSEGHLLFAGRWEYFVVGDEVVRAPIDAPIRVDVPYRGGARFEFKASQLPRRRDQGLFPFNADPEEAGFRVGSKESFSDAYEVVVPNDEQIASAARQVEDWRLDKKQLVHHTLSSIKSGEPGIVLLDRDGNLAASLGWYRSRQPTIPLSLNGLATSGVDGAGSRMMYEAAKVAVAEGRGMTLLSSGEGRKFYLALGMRPGSTAQMNFSWTVDEAAAFVRGVERA